MVDFIAYDMNNNITYMGTPSQEKQAGFFSIRDYIQTKTPMMTRDLEGYELIMENIIPLG